MNGLEPGGGGAPAPQEAKMNPQAPLGIGQEQRLYGTPVTPQGSPMMQAFGNELSAAHAQYTKLSETAQRLGVVRREMDKLVAMGDAVDQEDVVSAAGVLVAHGIGAVPMATLLADMPAKGEALQAWLRQQDEIIRKNEAAIQQPLAESRHQLAMVGLHNFVGHMAEVHQAGQAEAAGPLGPQGGQQALPSPETAAPANELAPGASED